MNQNPKQETFTDVLDIASSLRTKVDNTGAADQLKIDPNFSEDPVSAKVIEFGIKHRKNTLIVGPTGCGKSSLVFNVAARLKERLEVFNCSGETSVDELIGKPWKVEKNGLAVTIPVYGAAIRAYRDGKGLLLEEMDFANPDIQASLHRIMEPSQSFVHVNVGEPETIKRHRDFFVMATANTIGSGEDNFLYSGTKVLNEAFKNRISLTVRMDFLPKATEINVIIKKTGIHRDIARKMVDIADDAREKQTTDSIDRIASILSTRDLLSWSEAIVGMKLNAPEAAKFAFLNRWPEADREVVEKLIQNRNI